MDFDKKANIMLEHYKHIIKERTFDEYGILGFLIFIRDYIKNYSYPYTYQLIEDNQVLDIVGLKVKGILTPGHTPGSTCYPINDEDLFTGDTLKLENQKAAVFNAFFNMDTAAQKESIVKLAGLTGIKYVFTDHYGYSDNAAKVFEGCN